ncbi:hemolysin-type calcium-binding region [Nostoc linckia NIES-25]|nr:hemolysin-type calcium-binding region [Nostoc linckia NIES-25]
MGTTNAIATKQTLVIIDAGIDDHQILELGILPTAKVAVLNKHIDGIDQISALCKNHPAASIQIIAHGSPGSLQLGNSQLNLANLHTYRQQLQQWFATEILIYGCEVAAGETGKTFIESLHQLTGTNIAASAGKIGNAQLGGSWELEVKIGEIDSSLALQPEIREAYPKVLASFATASNFTVGTGPISIAVGDFNGDSNLDLVAANSTSNKVSVLLGNGTGGFGAASNFTVGTSPQSVTVGDFNGDGNLDLVAANSTSNNVSVLLGNGTGGFDIATNFSAGTNPQSVTVGDFNGDGNLDLAVTNRTTSKVSVLLGDGTGSFGNPTNFTVGTNPQSVTVADFNGDGNLDLAVANKNSNKVSVLLGDGTGSFGTASNFTVGTGPQSVTVGDFNGDGKLDLVTANYTSNNISVLLGNGTGGFGTATNFSAGSSPRSVIVGDFNSDGKLDLATANRNGSNVSVLLGNGTGGFGTPSKFTVGNSPRSITVGDFNGDGKLDLATANFGNNKVSVLLNTTPKITIASGTNPKEGGPDGSFIITLDTPAPVGGLVVKFNTIGSTATPTTDYTLAAADTNITALTANTFVIAQGKTTATLKVTAVTDIPLADPNETVTINLESSPDYILGASITATLTIAEPIAPVVTPTNTPLAYTENDTATAIDSGLTVTDADSSNLSGATVSITSGFVAAEDTLAFTTQNGITGSYSNGVLTLTGSASVANYQTALRSITYQNSSDNPSTTTRTISFIVNDGSLNSTTVTRNINLTAVNDAPVVTATNTPLAYIENDPAKVIDSGFTVTDIDSNNLNSATITITSGFVAAEDILGFTAQNGITGSYSNGVLTLSGSATVAQYQTALRSVTYQNTSDNPTTTRTISFVVNDGSSNSNTVTRNINITAVNDAPVITANSTPLAYIENDAATAIDSGLTVTDADSTNLNGATVSISSGFVAAQDILGFTAQNGISGSYSNGVLTLTGSATVANYQTALRSVTYQNTSDNPSTATRTISFIVNDGSLNSSTVTRNINITAVNDAPVVTATNTPLAYTENDPAKVIDSGLMVTDVDSANLNGATVSISSGFVGVEDILGFTAQNGISGSYSNGVLTLTGSASVANYQTALRSIAYQNTSDNPSTTTRTISFIVNDGSSDSIAATRNINITAVNDAPIITPTNTPLAYTENDGATAIDSGLTVTDVDSTNLNGATVSISSGFVAAEDILGFTAQNGISGSYSNGVLILTGSATVAQYQTALRSVTYQNSSDNPSTTTRTISFIVNDGSLNSSTVTRNINIAAVNDAPVVTPTNTPLAYTENDAATAIDSGLTVTDADSINLSGATITISSGFVAAQDILGFTAQNGISGSYSNGVLTLTGSATVAQYQTALRSIAYQNTSDNPSTTTRTISFIVNDGSLNSSTVTRNINLTAVNDAPVITSTNTPLAYTENDAATAIDSGLTVTDVDSTNLNSATVSISSGFVAAEDTLAFIAQNGISGSYSNGVLTLTGSASVADYQTALRSITYQNSSDNPSTTTRTISFVVNDGSLNSTTATRNINIAAVNDAPVVTPTNTPLAYTEKDAATAIDSGLTVTDADSINLSGATISITSGFVAAEDTLAFIAQNGISGSYSNGVLTLTGSASVADYQTALRSITYQNSSDNPSTTTRTISFVVNDGSLNSTTATRNINITAVNDAPVVTPTNTPLTYTENDAATAIDSGFTVTDVDSNNLNSATISITSGFVAAEDTLAFIAQNGISGSYSNGVLTLTGTASVADYQTALRSVSYQNSSDNPSTATRTISFVVNDGSSDSIAATCDINITAVNDAPVIAATNTPLTYTENDDATVIDSGISISDADSSNLNGAIVNISSGFIAAEDSLGFTAQNGISGNYSNGILTLTGSASVADYQTALRSITYQNSSDNPTISRTISFVVNDGSSDSTAATRDINLIPLNDAPVISATNTPLAYTENDAAKVIDLDLTIIDVDSTNLSSATVSIIGFVAAEDSLAFTAQNGISGSYSNGVLTLTGSASVADYQTALRSVTYQNSSNNPSAITRTISFVVNDGSSDSIAATRDIDFTAVDNTPVIAATNTPLDYTENDDATIIDSGITISDVDSSNLNSATVSIINFLATEDILAFTDQNGITGSYSNGVLTLSGSASVAQYQTALRSVTYQNSSDNPTTNRTISFVVNDGSSDSTAATRDINLIPVNDVPVITATGTPLEYTENDPAKAIDPDIAIADVDSSNLESATISISSGFVAAEDTLAFIAQNGITGSYSNGVLTLSGSASIADYQTALRSVTYQNSSDNPTTSRTISFVVNDGSSDSIAATRDINLIPVNDAPVITATGTPLDYTENDDATIIDSGITISDVDSSNLSSATVSIIDFLATEDILAFTDQNGITGSYSNGVLTLTGSATAAQYQIALRSVTYKNSSNKPSTTKRSINFVVNDGSLDSIIATRDISFTPVIDEEIPSRLTNPNDDVFNITGEDIKVRLEIKLTGHSSNSVNELGLFTVDDALGTINGIAPGADGYAAAALQRSQVILSAIANTPNGFDSNNLTTLLELTSGQNFRFLLVKDSTFDAVRNDPNSIGKLLFSDVSTQQITALGDDNFSLGWKDFANNTATDFNALVVKIKQTNQALPLGTKLQSKFQGEMIDLRDVEQSVIAEFNVYREAAYNNYVGFYQVIDENGGIDTNGDGVADILTGQAGYTQAAVRSRVAGIDLSVSNQGSATYSGTFQPGGIFAPFIIVDGTPDALLDKNSNNDPAVYFPFLGANSDGLDHIRLLGNNTFGFEDLPGGGDRDFNDMIVKVNLTATI